MNRWIVFDDVAVAAVESKINSRPELRNPGDEPAARIVALAAAAPGMAVAILPASREGRALLLRFTRPASPPAAETMPAISGARVAPGGFLGLGDELVLEDEPEAPKKWWQKILD